LQSEQVHSHTPDRAQALVGAIVVVLTLAVFALYVCTLGKQSLWCDEGISVEFATGSLSQILRTLSREDLHPPLYYLILHYWMLLAGISEWALRLPSVLAATLLIPLTFAVVREVWHDQRDVVWAQAIAGTLAAALVGTSPFIAFYAQETRMYSLVAALVLATILAYLKAIRSPSRHWWLTFSALLAASMYTQYFSILVVPAFVLYTLLFDRTSLVRTLRYLGLAGLLYLPQLYPAYLQLSRLQLSPDYWVTTRIQPLQFLSTMLNSVLPSASQRWVALIAVAGVLTLFALALRARFRVATRERRALVVLTTCLVPLGLTYVLVAMIPKFATRYVIIAMAPLYICVSLLSYAALGKKPYTRALLGLLGMVAVAVSLQSTLAVVEGRSNARDDTRGTVAYLQQNMQANDALLIIENIPHVFHYYYHGDVPLYGYHVGLDFSGAANLLTQIIHTQPRRIWLVHWHHEFADPTELSGRIERLEDGHLPAILRLSTVRV